MNVHIRQKLYDQYNATDLSAFNGLQRPIVENLLRQAISDALPYDGECRADWLLVGGLGDARWQTLNGNKTRFADGKYEKTCDAIFDRILPDDTNLLDEENAILLEAVQKAAFLLRSGLLDSSPGPQSWLRSVGWLLDLSSWCILHESSLQPRLRGFSLIDQNALNLLYHQLSINGWIEALEVIPKLLSYLYRSAMGREVPPELEDRPLELPEEVCAQTVKYLKANAMYGSQNRRTVCRKAIAGILHMEERSLGTRKLGVFLRQFEPDLQHPHLLINEKILTEFPNQNTPLMSEVKEGTPKEGSFKSHLIQFNRFLPAYRHLPMLFPDPRSIEVRQAYNLSRHRTQLSGHHRLIPSDIGLTYLNESMRWVIVYGDAIIKGVLEMTEEVVRINSLDGGVNAKAAIKHRAFSEISAALKTTAMPGESGQTLNEAINLSCYLRSSANQSFVLNRSAPSLMDALEALVGACVISIAMLKPSRDEEIWSLKRSCAIRRQSDRGDIWWLEFELGKSGQMGVNQKAQKPIPYFTAKAVSLLQRLGDGLQQIYSDDSPYADDLFYLPTTGFGKPTGKDVRSRVNNCLNRFCDYVNLPVDQYGRRWYVRIHEMRKWFLLMMFWHGRYGVLDAVRWIAGHTDAKHVYAYIEANFPGEELPRLEAQCVDEKLIELERGNVREGDSGLVALYNVVCKHFGVASIEGIRGAEYIEYLEDLRAEELYHIEPYSIYSDDGQEVAGIEIAVKFSGKA